MSGEKLVVRFRRLGLGVYETSPKSPKIDSTCSPRLVNKVRRNLNSSFGEKSPPSPKNRRPRRSCVSRKSYNENLAFSPIENFSVLRNSTRVNILPDDLKLTLAIDNLKKTCKWKGFVELSSDDSESDTENRSETIVTHTKRKTSKSDHFEDSVSPSKGSRYTERQKHVTPRKNKLSTTEVATPSNKSLGKTPKSTAKTPRSTLKLMKDGILTPKVPSRSTILQLDNTPLKQARSQLHVSFVPDNLPCREKEHKDIRNFLKGKLRDNCGGCMYISGVPGTGKTATVTSVINNLITLSKTGDVPAFDSVNINGMKLTEPRQAYVEIWKQLQGKTVTWEQALNSLEDLLTKKAKKSSKRPIILLVDELDIICTKRQDVVYNLLDWPTKSTAHLIVITIANTMDLPERLLMNRVNSRLGLTRLTFQPYTYKQLQEIVTKRLVGINSFNPEAVELVARKVASVSGDARRALDICRRAAENAEKEGDDTLVTMEHVNEALKTMITQPKVRAIKNCSRLEQYILQSVIAEVERTGVEETIFSDVFKTLPSIAVMHGFKMTSVSMTLRAVARLSSCRLLLTDQKCNDLDQKIILNVSADDVYYALREE